MSAISFVAVPDYDKLEGYKTISFGSFVALLSRKRSFIFMTTEAATNTCASAERLNDSIKDYIIKNPERNIEAIINDLGDLRFYMQAIMNLFGLDEQTILQANADKLVERYKELVYNSEAPNRRADKDSGD